MLDVVRGVEVYLSKYTGHSKSISDSRFPNCEWLGGEWRGRELSSLRQECCTARGSVGARTWQGSGRITLDGWGGGKGEGGGGCVWEEVEGNERAGGLE